MRRHDWHINSAQESERDAVEIDDEPRVAEYLALARQAAAQRAALRSTTFAPKHALPFLQPGRLVRLLAPPPAAGTAPAAAGNAADISAAEGLLEEPTVWGAIVNFERVGGKSKGACCTLAECDRLSWVMLAGSHVLLRWDLWIIWKKVLFHIFFNDFFLLYPGHGTYPMLLVCCASTLSTNGACRWREEEECCVIHRGRPRALRGRQRADARQQATAAPRAAVAGGRRPPGHYLPA